MVLISRPHESTLGERLERVRAEHRAMRLERILEALHARARDYAPAGVPVGLRAAATDFEHELTSVRARLAAELDLGEQG